MAGPKKPKEPLWNRADLNFDSNGRLVIKNKKLARKLQKVYESKKHKLWIKRVRLPEDPKSENGGVGGNTVNTMCPCEGP